MIEGDTGRFRVGAEYRSQDSAVAGTEIEDTAHRARHALDEHRFALAAVGKLDPVRQVGAGVVGVVPASLGGCIGLVRGHGASDTISASPTLLDSRPVSSRES